MFVDYYKVVHLVATLPVFVNRFLKSSPNGSKSLVLRQIYKINSRGRALGPPSSLGDIPDPPECHCFPQYFIQHTPIDCNQLTLTHFLKNIVLLPFTHSITNNLQQPKTEFFKSKNENRNPVIRLLYFWFLLANSLPTEC